jgi:hypothetical protein
LAETLFGKRDGSGVGDIELVPRVACAIHNDLDGHFLRSFLLTRR